LDGPVEMLHLTEAGIWIERDSPHSPIQDAEPWPEPYLFSPSLLMESPRCNEGDFGVTPAQDTIGSSPPITHGDNLPEPNLSQSREGEAEEIFVRAPLETEQEDKLTLESPSWAIISELPITNPHPSSSSLAIFPSLLHDKVGDRINFFQMQADGFFARSLGRSTAYADMMKKIFREKDLPEELFYLALIESGFNPKAFSKSKASGIWQFIGKTAKRFGLKVDKWVDERRDPEKATYAAAEYLKSLYALFNNWDLATAGYNAGEGKILKAMKKAKSQDFWKISQQRLLKKETKEYVPLFLAALTIAENPQKYGFQNIEYSPPVVYEKVTVPPGTNLLIIAKAAESDLSQIQALNPALKKGKTPPHSFFEVKLPLGKREVFQSNFPALSQMAVKSKKHRVGKGESLRKIAQKYQLTLQALCDMNDLSPKTRIRPGIILLLPPA
jgi:membrane-bound lytic murein transglycosylase D